jgi:hypothetical protein
VVKGKKIFLNLPAGAGLFKIKAPDTPFPPTAVSTRGETSLDTTVYYADTLCSVVSEFGRKDVPSIAYCKKYFIFYI